LLDKFTTVNPRDCEHFPPDNTSDTYRIYPDNSDVIDVYWDMDIDGGGWTVCSCIIIKIKLKLNGYINICIPISVKVD